MRHGEVSTKTLENRTLLSGWLDEGTLGRFLASFGSALLRREAAGCILAAIGPPKWGFPIN
jgi:hypothetical protein